MAESPAAPLAGKVALVTGGSRGIGAAIAARLAADGADVVISYGAAHEKAEAVVRGLAAQGVRAAAIQADQGVTADVTRLVREAAARFGRLDILVNNAAVHVPFAAGDPAADGAALDRQLAVNIGGVAAAVREAAKLLPDGGRIITIGSSSASRPSAGAAEYSGTKAAIAAFSRGWARDLGPRSITVNTVQPGPVDTDMNPDNGGENSERLKTQIPLGRYGRASEIADVVAFLAGPAAAYITGATITVDGGFSA